MTGTRRSRALRAGLSVVTAGLLAGCSQSVSGTPVPPSTVLPPVPTVTVTAPVPSASTPAGGGRAGCAPTGAALPAGAAVATTADLDHDGRPDELWLADVGNQRLLGVRTASGAVFSTTFTSAAPQRASALGQELGPGLSIVLLDAGRSVPLYAVVDCHLEPTLNPQGQQYTFDLGFTGYGTGVGCEPARDAPRRLDLYGLLAHQVGGGSWTVTGTRIQLDDAGRAAQNGPSSDLVTGADGQAAAVEAARKITCGDQVGGPAEPQT